MYIRNLKNRLNRKPNIMNLCVCELEHINTIYLYTRSKQTEVFLSILFFKTIRSKKLDSNRVLDAILMRELLNLHVLAPKTPLLKLSTY